MGGSKAGDLTTLPFPSPPPFHSPKFSDKPVGGKGRSSEGEVPRLPLPPTNTTLLGLLLYYYDDDDDDDDDHHHHHRHHHHYHHHNHHYYYYYY